MRSEKFASLQRKSLITVVIIVSVTTIGFRLFQMQILNQTSYDDKSADNSIKMVEQLPPRGVFYDRNMTLLVNNIPAYTLRVTPADYDLSLNKSLETILGADPGYIDGLLKKYKGYSKFLPIKVRRGIGFDIVAWVEENSEKLPGVDYVVEMRRGYPAGVNGSHLFGYAREITEKQLKKEKEYYKQGDVIGYKGIEKTYEKELRGRKGSKFVLVNSFRKKIGDYKGGAEDIPPIKGNDIVLTIEASTQRVAEEMFVGKRGALVAIEPATGEILALVSAPEYDLNRFSHITSENFLNTLYNDPEKPLFNRATMSVQSPGSTYKMLSAIAALDLGIITTSWTIHCTGAYTYGREFKCHGVHGTVNVIQAIEKSCNVFFYQLVLKLGIENWADYSSRFGFDVKTGIDIGEESPGLIPDASYYEKVYGLEWPRSITLSLSIGQGETGVTPLQLAQYTALIGNRGKSYQPHLVRGHIDYNTKRIVHYDYKEIEVGAGRKALDIVREGMYLVVHGSKGTATHLRWSDYEISGKTGTAQNPHGEDHAWFVSFAPYDNPQIAVAVLVENVGFGSTHAAPIAKKVTEAYLNSVKQNLRIEEQQITKLENTPLGN
jgi:penicillin-binding protein 2